MKNTKVAYSHASATCIVNALTLAIPNANQRTGFKTWLDNHCDDATASPRMFAIDTGTTVDRVLILESEQISLVSERDLRKGAGFEYVGETGKKVRVNFDTLGWTFTRIASVADGLAPYPTLTKESSGEARYDKVMGRKASTPTDASNDTPKGKPSKPSKGKKKTRDGFTVNAPPVSTTPPQDEPSNDTPDMSEAVDTSALDPNAMTDEQVERELEAMTAPPV